MLTFILTIMIPGLESRCNGSAEICELENGRWRLEIPAGPAGAYRWAQLDDYMGQRRKDFLWRQSPGPLRLKLRVRVSAADLPGTWGFGFWNDPFNASLGVGGTTARLPALPNTAWFFYAGEPNYLAFRDDHPAQGFLAASFASPQIPSLALAPGLLALPLLAVRPTARLLRRAASRVIGEAGALIPVDPVQWHGYRLELSKGRAVFWVDDNEVLATSVSPSGPLGLLIWIDNQYAAFPPSGKLAMGTSPNPQPAWLEMEDIEVSSG